MYLCVYRALVHESALIWLKLQQDVRCFGFNTASLGSE